MWPIWQAAETHTGFWWGDRRERDHMEDLGVVGKIIFKLISRSGMRGTDWIDLAQGKERWRAPVNRVMNLRVP